MPLDGELEFCEELGELDEEFEDELGEELEEEGEDEPVEDSDDGRSGIGV